MNSKKYWQKRAEQIAKTQFNKVDKYNEILQEQYKKASYEIQRRIDSFYAKFADNNEIDLNDAKRLLKSNELEEFKMDLKEFTAKAKHNLNGKWEKELNNVSYKVRVSRLEALQTQIQHQIEVLTDGQHKGMNKLLNDVYEDTYYRNIYELEKGLGISVNFAKLDKDIIEKAINQKWIGKNFSSRVWNNKEKLINELQTNLIQSFIRGDPIDKTASTLAKRMNVAKNRALTLVNTESSYITNKSTMDSYKSSGVVKQYEILATLDTRTSPICRSMDGKVFKVSEMQPGVNAPPFHPNCRTTTIAYFDDAVDEKRIARDNEGNNYYVDGNMNYKTWYSKYVKGDPKEIIAEKKHKNRYNDKKQYERYKEVLRKEVPKSFDKFHDMKYNDSEEWDRLVYNYNKTNLFNKVVEESSSLNIKGKVIKDINRIDISDYKFAEFHINSERHHSVNKDMAQNYINNAKVAYSRWNGQVIVYVSEKGCSVVNLKNKIISTAYKSDEYDDKFKKLMEVLKND